MKTRRHLHHRTKARDLARKATISDPTPEAKRAREDLAYFGEYVMGKKAMPHHKVWIDALVTGEDSSQLKKVAGQDTAILSPRGSAKSTWIGLFIAWVIGHNPDCQIIYCAYSENVSLSRSRLIQRIISSPKYREVFPEILPGKRWSATDWEIDKSFVGVTDLESDYTFLAVGATGSITSKRSKLIIIDDPIKSSESIENPEIREKLETNWSEVLQPTLIPGGRVIAIGTRFRADDLFAKVFVSDNGWKCIEQSAIIESEKTGEEESYWKERYPIESLWKLREASPITFSFQFQNKIVRSAEISVDPDWITRTAIAIEPDEFDTLVLGVDLSPTEREASDYTAFVLGGRKDSHYYILDFWMGRSAGNLPKLNKMLDIATEWGVLDAVEKNGKTYYEPQLDMPLYIYCDDIAYQSSLAGDFRTVIVNEKKIYNLIYRPGNSKGSKLSRLRGISGLLENGLVSFNLYRPMGKLIDQLINFGAHEHDDAVDAMVYCLQGLSERSRLDAA